jgi:hypothetical protein
MIALPGLGDFSHDGAAPLPGRKGYLPVAK